MKPHPPTILVIKLGALGDFVLAFAAFAAIRSHHRGPITLLTTPLFAPLAARAPWVQLSGDGWPPKLVEPARCAALGASSPRPRHGL